MLIPSLLQTVTSMALFTPNRKLSALTIAYVGVMVATMVVGKEALGFIPNIEVVSLFTIVYTVYFGAAAALAVAVFIVIEGILYGIGWWFYGYLLAWPVLFLVSFLMRKRANNVTMALVSGFFGLGFGLLCEIPYSLMFGLKAGFAWWIAGIPWDLVHGVGNFVICIFLYNPLMRALKAVNKENK